MHAERPSVVLLGGHLCGPELWDAQCEALADVADCLPLALTGGRSMAELAATVLRAAPTTFSLAGLSMGGHVATEIMRAAPQRVSRLALIDTRADTDSPERMKIRLADDALVEAQGFEALAATLPDRWLGPRAARDPALQARVLHMVLAAGDALRREQLQALLDRIDSRPSLAAIRCPTLVLCGRDDAPNPVRLHEEMASLIPGARLRILDDCGHLSPIEQPTRVAAALREWLIW